MAYHDDLLEQAAQRVGTAGPGRPKQATLRRAVSTCYYAVFHFVIDEASRSIVGNANDLSPVRKLLARSFEHGDMLSTSKVFASGGLPATLQAALGHHPISSAVKKLAESFVKLQESRHSADYDLTDYFTLYDVRGAIDQLQRAMTEWQTSDKTDRSRQLFLLTLLTGLRSERRPKAK